jgi:hypothetical protein
MIVLGIGVTLYANYKMKSLSNERLSLIFLFIFL